MEGHSDAVEEEISKYKGGRNRKGRYQGRGTCTYKNGTVFRGRFVDGKRDGRGTLTYPDGSVLSGNYRGDALHGSATYTYDSGERMVSTYLYGELEGPFEEQDYNGFISCRGAFKGGQRCGNITFHWEDGGKLEGKVNEAGDVSGKFVYHYPDQRSVLRGDWEEGEMVCAKFSVDGEAEHPEAPSFAHDPATATHISREPLLADPYEARRVEVRRSLIPGANEGLFAQVDLQPLEVACFYSGCRLTHEEVDSRDWAENDNTLSIDDDTVIDVPAEYSSANKYCATLGHKANHSFTNNARYEPYMHPRFGEIKCIRAVAFIQAGAEITTHYDYNEIDENGQLVAPAWYKKAS
ncbi:hypothetical protein CYMTET_25613 [Cymbomonas tetramitiformis]|uniref:Histone-lysine N-methyltransferase SETD7 n=1 Tax=Cymbomonas tetramitiformis TaxID=36881 RepID=A0AAE0KYW6_9CHLO|nr:hypothetical protein CYMTET_25613 [Cymbomonas tetramitiformis]